MQILALRDEFLSRDFDLPDEWWAERPGVVGGRDRRGGGSWCASDVAAGVTAVVLNRPERPVASADAASRGVLPLHAIRHRERWPESVDVARMASFNLVVASPDSLLWWSFDGHRLRRHSLSSGTYKFTPRGLDGAPIERPLATGSAEFGGTDIGHSMALPCEVVWAQWLPVVRQSVPSPDHFGLVVQRPVGEDSYETVFGQFITARPSMLRLDYLTHVARDVLGDWTTRVWSTSASKTD